MTEETRPLAPAAIVAAGLVWTAWAALVALAGPSAGGVQLLAALSGVLLTAAFVAVVFRLHWIYDLPGGEGAGVGAVGGLLFGLGQLLRGTVGGDWSLLVAPGVLGLVAATVALGAGMVRARRTPPWVGVALAGTAVLFLGFDGSSTVARTLALPLGFAWLGAGGYLLGHPDRPSAPIEISAVGREREGDAE